MDDIDDHIDGHLDGELDGDETTNGQSGQSSYIGNLTSYGYEIISTFTLYTFLILSSSMFIYITLYTAYIPVVKVSRQAHIQFDSKCRDNCSNPYALVDFGRDLARGHPYRFVVTLEMPESDTNWNQGMFMIQLKLQSHGETIQQSTRPAILKYKTKLTRLLAALAYSPLIIFNYRYEAQKIEVQLIDSHTKIDNRLDQALLEIQARDVQIYSATLHAIANLTGLRFYMYYWPLTSAVVGMFTLATFMVSLSIYQP